MTVSDTPQPPERPEDEGIPDHAADTSTAYDDRPRLDDSPPALPADEPQAVDDFGVTAAEQRQGEPMDQRLAREEPDEGARSDSEQDMIATEQGKAGGGLTAEEAAMHALPDEEVPYRP